MISFATLPIALLAGIGLGLLYFGGLWLTVNQLPLTRNPILLTLGSFLGRLSLTGAGFYLVMREAPEAVVVNLGACLVMFFGVRNRMIEQLRPSPHRGRSISEGSQDGD
jgi:F1F0 ATPase subunit 2